MEKRDVNFVAFDFETSGLSPWRGARVIEIGAVKLEERRIVKTFHSLVNPQIYLPKSTERINGITADMLEGAPSPGRIFTKFQTFIKDTTLVAHNARFDINFLGAELSRLGLALTNRAECTLQESRRAYPELPNYRLETVARYLLGDISQNLTLHRALDDAKLTAMVWLEMMKRR